jgi:Golgi apparatus protein 1
MQIEDMMERRVRDFRLDTRMRTACEEDIYTMCAYFGVSGCERVR